MTSGFVANPEAGYDAVRAPSTPHNGEGWLKQDVSGTQTGWPET